eukprot:TRINITY_DN22933_c0_g1_i1.p1 TRINITY_DN22933_c0_g1~~TRINITY_DN22933_c0_g1_i1.p1  ORF type:complete len:2216 (+),score=492.89 TRINITY_DN22933_c0_g1_i1:184-6831(+)
MCCDANCANNLFACSTGFQKKATAASISCQGNSASCSNQLCCDVYCDNAGFQCGNYAGYTTRAAQATIRCGPTVSDCSPTLCCSALCSNRAFSCSAGHVLKGAAAATTCGTSVNDCTNAQCCDVTCGSTAFSCGTGYIKKANAAALTCGATVTSCTDLLCCDARCAVTSFSCPTGFTKKGNAASITCPNGRADQCTTAGCCDSLCSNTQFSCSTGHSPKVNQQTISCSGAVSSCTDGLCCDATCSHPAFTCGTGFLPRPSQRDYICGASFTQCGVQDCCDATCDNAAWAGCSAGFGIQANPATIRCGANAAQCNDGTCCLATCQAHTCGVGFVPKANQAVVCGASASTCSDMLCCDATCNNAGFTCPRGYSPKAAQQNLLCGATAALCSTDTCCDVTCDNTRFVCAAGYQPKNNQHQITCGGTPTECDNTKCCDATCSNPMFTCPLGYQEKSTNSLILCGATPQTCTVGLCCDATLCGRDQKVFMNACVACEPGATNDPNDNAGGADTRCDAVLCATNFFVKSNICAPCPAGETNRPNDDATGGDTFCDVTYCAVNQRVLNNVCVACPDGTTNTAGDMANRGDTQCDAVLCAANQRVQSHRCVACPVGSTNAPNDNAQNADTQCDPVSCLSNQRVQNNRCVGCPSGSTNSAGDLATGSDTLCDKVICGSNQRVSNHACVTCALGSTNQAGDDASGGNTQCDPVLCAENQRVVSNACSACPPGSINQANDDASGPDTLCDAILCAVNQRVASHACAACPPGSVNAPQDDASGPDTQCDKTLCRVNERVFNHMCVPCEAGSTNVGGDDATAPDTLCDTIYCLVDQRVSNHQCVPCANSYRNQVGDPATGPDTSCEKAAGIRVEPNGLLTNEQGDAATFTVVLESKPYSEVRIALRSSNTGEGSVDDNLLVFSESNWGAPRTVTVRGVQDAVDDGDKSYTIILERASSADAAYNGLDPADVSVTNVDDDTIGVSVSPLAELVTNEAGGTGTFLVALHTQPTEDVTISLTSTDTTEGTVSPAELVFTSGSLPSGMGRWSTPQVVTVTGVDDKMQDGQVGFQVITGVTVSKDPLYSGINPADISVVNLDDDIAGLQVDPVTSLLTTEEGGSAKLAVRLLTQPLSVVDMQLGVSSTREASVEPVRLQFTSSSWDVPQTITVQGRDDAIDDGDVHFNVTFSTTSSEAAYNGIAWPGRTLINVDNDKAGITAVTKLDLRTAENGSFAAMFSIVLHSEPTAAVNLQLSSTDTTEGNPQPAAVTFSPATWNTPVVVSVVGKQDDIDDGDVSFLIKMGTASSSDPNYDGVPVPDQHVRCVDDDEARIEVTPLSSGLTNTTEGGGSVSFNIRIATQPLEDVTVDLQTSDHTEAVVSVPSVVFRPVAWREVFTVIVTGADDKVQDGPQPFELVTSQARTNDATYRNIDPINVRLFNIDDDIAGITVTPTTGLQTTEAGGSDHFNISLATQPASDVLFRFFSDDTSEGRLQPSEALFTPGSWDAPRKISIIGVQDAVDDGDTVFAIKSSGPITTDPVYARLTVAEVTVVNKEDDKAGVTTNVIGGSLVTSETGNTTQFTIMLNTQPVADVTVNIRVSDENEVKASPTVVTFNDGVTQEGQTGRGHWGTPQTITLTGVDDTEADGTKQFTIYFGGVESTDPRYSGMQLPALTGKNVDNDRAEVVVSQPSSAIISETGLSATFTMHLAAQPRDTVTCPVSSSDPTEALLGAAQVVFTPADWSAPHTVKVTGVDDTIYDGDVDVTVQVHACTSRDVSFNGIDPPDVKFTNRDIDSGGAYLIAVLSMQVVQGSPVTCEGPLIAQFAATFAVSATNIANCRIQPSNPQEGVSYDVVTLEVHEIGPTAGACDRLRLLAANVNSARNNGVTLAGRRLEDAATRTVHCPRVMCSSFGASSCASGRLHSNKTCIDDVCDALTCCEPAQISFVVFKNSTCGALEYSISQETSGQVCQRVNRPDGSGAEFGALYCDAASNLAYARTGYSSLTRCGDAIGSLERLTADPATVVFPCSCRGAQNVQISGRTCSPVQRGGTPLHASCGAGTLSDVSPNLGTDAPDVNAGDTDDGIATWKWIAFLAAAVLALLILIALIWWCCLRTKPEEHEPVEQSPSSPVLKEPLLKEETRYYEAHNNNHVEDPNRDRVIHEEPYKPEPYSHYTTADPYLLGSGRGLARDSALVTPNRVTGVRTFNHMAPPAPSYLPNPLSDTHYMTQPLVH